MEVAQYLKQPPALLLRGLLLPLHVRFYFSASPRFRLPRGGVRLLTGGSLCSGCRLRLLLLYAALLLLNLLRGCRLLLWSRRVHQRHITNFDGGSLPQPLSGRCLSICRMSENGIRPWKQLHPPKPST